MFSDTTLTPLTQILHALDALVDKAEAHAAARKIAPDALLFARLYPDMYHFTRQVQTACDFAMKIAARLSGKEPEKLDFSERTFAELKALIARAIAAVQGADRAAVDASFDQPVTYFINERAVTMTGIAYAHRFGMPNFYFHASMAYAILRENGVNLGKADFIGRLKD